MLRWLCVVLVLAFWMSTVPASANQRIALVIGNQGYNANVGPLKNPHNDIAVVGKALGEVGFKLLAPRKDATRDEMLFAVHDLASRLRKAGPGSVSFLYYAGHGVAVGEENVLIPVNAEDTTDAMLAVRGVRLGEILDIMKREAPEAVHFVVLDACRNMRGQRGERGFAPVNDQRTGVVIAFSTAAGRTATDEGATGAPYAAALAGEIVKPGLNDQAVFNAVRAHVVAATRHRTPPQTPWTHDGLVGERIVFKAASPPAVSAPPTPAIAPSTPVYSAAAEAARVCREVEGMSSLSLLGVLANQHKGTPAADCIATRMDELRKQLVAAAAPPAAKPVPAPEVKPAVQVNPAPTLTAGTVFRDCADCPEMVVVSAGSFMMGSPAGEEGRSGDEGPQRQVRIARPFAVRKYEVTFAEWDACVSGGGCKHNPGDQGWGRGRRPVINVSWDDITKEYLPWLSRKTGKTYRLLTEAEWEYAARAGTTTPFSTGSTITANQANFDGNYTYGGSTKGQYRQRTVDVGSFQANGFGLYDVHGNVWEWVQDCWYGNYNGAPTDGSTWTTRDCGSRVLRGGSWYLIPQDLRSANRDRSRPDDRDYIKGGFRLARTLSP
jgi:formylglycine-generating enzyme required for sulfatase activity